MTDPPGLASAHDALQRGAWADAARGFAAVLADGEDPFAEECIAQAYWWLDDAEECLRSREAAYRAYRDQDDALGAARAATALAWDAVLFGQGAAVARGWHARAADLLKRLPTSAVHGWHAVRGAELALTLDDDPDAAVRSSERAHAIGIDTGDADLTFAGQAYTGLALVMSGHVPDGMPLLDHAVAAATAGDVIDPMWMGKICCWLIVACRQSQDMERASEWSARVEAISRARELVPLTSVCRIQYAAVQIFRGAWVEADAQLRSTLELLTGSRRESRLEAVAQLGELRRRQGRLAEAEALLRQAEFFGPAVVSRARLRLDRGDANRAWTELSAVLDSLPSANLLARAAVLPTAIAAAVACGNEGDAQRLAFELTAISGRVPTDAIRGFAAAASASVETGPSALPFWREAVRRFLACGLRYEEAQTRQSYGGALAVLGDLSGASEQKTLATAILADLGVAANGGDALLTPREVEVLRLVAHGMSNAEIARELTLSEHTVHRHVANILSRLGVASRTAAATYATTAQLL